MTKKIAFAIVQIYAIFISPAIAQNNVVDVITLKNDNGVVKGFVNEQVVGETLRIIPSTSVLKLEMKDISGTPTIRSVKKDSINEALDVVVMKNGMTIEGKIVEKAPDKWLKIKTDNLAPQTYRYDAMEKIGKETINPNDNIFKAYGVLDVINIRNGEVVKGVIIEQVLGSLIKIKTLDKGILVYDIADIASTSKEAFDKSRDIFKQSAYLDVLNLKNGSSIKGIIMQQTPSQEIKIETIGNSNFVQKMVDVVKLSKEKNPYKEEVKVDSAKVAVKEPEFIGECFWVNSPDSVKIIEKQGYVRGMQNRSLLLLDGGISSTTPIPQSEIITFIVKVKTNNISPLDQIHIFRIELNKGVKKRCINSSRYLFLSPDADRDAKPSLVRFEYVRIGESSFKIKCKISETGEYAIHVDGCDKTFSLFKVVAQKPKEK